MKCPIDNTELTQEKYEDTVDIETCSTCHGAWLDNGELEKIQDVTVNDYKAELEMLPDHVGKAFARAEEEAKELISCPVCNAEMERKEYAFASQILVDSCVKGHGTWLDNGELRALEIFYERMSNDSVNAKRGFLAGLLASIKK